MRNIIQFWKIHCVGLVLVGATIFFAWLYLFLYHGEYNRSTLIFNQPDEMANYAFIKEWVLHDQVGIAEPLTELAQSQVHPRSMTVVNGRLVPIGFPGFIAVVTAFVQPFVWLFGVDSFNWFVVLFTPLLAASSSILMYGISRSLGLSKGVAMISGLSLLVIPPWWYYASRPLQVNTTLVFFILVSIWTGLRKNNRISRFFLLGLSSGLALYVRPSEWVWVLGLLGVIGYYNREYLQFKNVMWFGLGSGFMALIFFLTQYAFYGSVLGSGYVRPNSDGSAGLIMAGPQGIRFVQALILPFGFNAFAIVKTVYQYGLTLFLPWVIMIVTGLGFLVINRKQVPVLSKYAISLLGLSVWLAVYYGSWQFTDNLANQVSIGSSQVRYFLPVYVLAVPLVAYALSKMYTWNWSGKVMVAIISSALLIFSVKSVYFKFEGLYRIKQTVTTYYEWREKIMAVTPENAIIVTRYADKYLFPERKIIATGETADGYDAITNLVRAGKRVYWYNISSEKTNLTLDKPLVSWENLELRQVLLTK